MKKEQITQAIWATAVAVNVGLLLLLLNGLKAEGFFARSNPMNPQRDPKIGSEIPSPLQTFLNPQKPLLVIAFGRCSECTLRNLNGWVVMLERWGEEVSGVIVAEEREEALKGYARQFDWEVPVLADEKGKVLRELNAYFLPRAYSFNLEGKLVWVQTDPTASELEIIRSVVEAVKGKEYARKVFDRPPAWERALKTSKAGEGR